MSHLHALQHGMGREMLKDLILADSPTAYWVCNDSTGSTIVDHSGNGFDLTKHANTILVEDALYPVPDGSRYMRIPQTLAAGASRAGSLGITTPITGDWSWECILRCYAPPSATDTTLFFIVGNGETENVNAQLNVNFNSSAVFVLWETGAGTNITTTPTAQFAPVAGYASHYLITKSGTSLSFYMNGRKLETISASGNPSGGTGTVGTGIGTEGTYATGTNASGYIIGHVAFYNGTVLTEEKARARAWACGLWGTSI